MARVRPLIGITVGVAQARWRDWAAGAYVVHEEYERAVTAAGGVALLVPCAEGLCVESLVPRLDGLVLSGGVDVAPDRYGGIESPASSHHQPVRDGVELSLVRACQNEAIPVLGICRGAQLMNVARGGTLIHHLPDVTGNDGHLSQPGAFASRVVATSPGSRVSALVGLSPTVSCYHHQAVHRLGENLVAVAHDADGVIEAVEDPAAPFFVGVQWHPEQGPGHRDLFKALVDAARLRQGDPP
jgi:putative glutamine amidotransferase